MEEESLDGKAEVGVVCYEKQKELESLLGQQIVSVQG